MDFSLSPEIDAIRSRIRAFVEERLIPLERDPASYDEHENIARPLLERMRAEARKQGLWALGDAEGAAAAAACPWRSSRPATRR